MQKPDPESNDVERLGIMTASDIQEIMPRALSSLALCLAQRCIVDQNLQEILDNIRAAESLSERQHVILERLCRDALKHAYKSKE